MTQEDLHRLAYGTDGEAKAAFDRLATQARPVLLRFLRRFTPSSDDREDFVQATLNRVWAGRRSFEPQGEAAWWRFLRQVALNIFRDHLRKHAGTTTSSLDDVVEPPDGDIPHLDSMLASLSERDRLYTAADSLWLGEQGIDGARRLLAAQLFYIDRCSVNQVQQLLSPESLDDWLLDPPTLRRLAFRQLYWSNDRLASQVLGINPKDLDKVSAEVNEDIGSGPVDGWSPPEIRVLLWRVRNGLLKEQIGRFSRCEFSPQALESLFRRFVAKYPMAAEAKRLMEVLPPSVRNAILARDGVWKRLAFQYHCADALPQLQILERISDAATVVGFRITEGVLAGWISVGRMFDALAAFVEVNQCA